MKVVFKALDNSPTLIIRLLGYFADSDITARAAMEILVAYYRYSVTIRYSSTI